MSQTTAGNDNSAIMAAVKEAWSDGYKTAVVTLREIADASKNEELAEVIHSLANMLENVKP